MSRIVQTSAVVALLVSGARADKPSADGAKFFEQHIRPIFVERCSKCHGGKQTKGGLRLDTRERAFKGGESGAVIVPRKPDESLLLDAVNWQSLEMPPKEKLPDTAIARIRKWIEMGAPWPDSDPRRDDGDLFTDDDHTFWSFQPLRDVSVPSVTSKWTRNDVDRFILRALNDAGLEPAPRANPRVLVRRLYLDLTGLPPTREQIEAFVADPTDKAWESLVDELLASPRYGERQASFWLDLVRYAESDGYKQDAYRANAWRYRDYVIKAFNADKPYDRFVLEQLAGDELESPSPETLAATSFLRHWIYEYNQRDIRNQWSIILNDVTDVTAETFLGLGFACARCHDHKFDPILQRDYYRLQAFFAAMLPHDAPFGSSDQLAQYDAQMSEWEDQTKKLRTTLEQMATPHVRSTVKVNVDRFPPDVRSGLLKQPDDRDAEENQLAWLAFRQFESRWSRMAIGKMMKGDDKKRWDKLEGELKKFDKLKPKDLPTVLTVTETGAAAAPVTIPGEDERIPPGYLTLLRPEPAEIAAPDHGRSTGRRTALAQWLTSSDNPLTSRVMVNRLWQHHFGRGLVGTPSDFGRLGDRPSHPELLDWLAARFIASRWSMKAVHRVILNSATYRQSSQNASAERAREVDPSNRLLWRASVRRMDAEQIRDSLLAVSGELKLLDGGPGQESKVFCRSVYLKRLRNRPDALLMAFDGTDGILSTPERNTTTTPNQALIMLNNPFVASRSRALAARAEKAFPVDNRKRVVWTYETVFGRPPTSEQVQDALAFFEGREATAWADFCHVLVNSNEFIYID